MDIRTALESGLEYAMWLDRSISFKLVDQTKLLPKIEIDVEKEGKVISTIILEHRPYFIFGAHPEKSSIVLEHPSISRCHSAIVIDQDQGAVVVDLMSKAGTKVNKT